VTHAQAGRFTGDAAQARCGQAYEKTLASSGVAVKSHEVPTTFASTHVVEAGDVANPPLVLLHAMSFSASVWVRNLAASSPSTRSAT
jgi:hypothetical protein